MPSVSTLQTFVQNNNVAVSPTLAAAISTAISSTGTAVSVTASVAYTTYNSNPTSTYIVADTAINLLNVLYKSALLRATSVKLIGTNNTVSVTDASFLISLPGFTVDATASLSLSDSATSLASASSLLFSKASSVVVTGTATATQATTIYGKKATASYSISDTAANVAGASASVLGQATAVDVPEQPRLRRQL